MLGVGWVKRSADPTPLAGGDRIYIGSSLTLDPTYGYSWMARRQAHHG
jgi:hypothetical protein